MDKQLHPLVYVEIAYSLTNVNGVTVVQSFGMEIDVIPHFTRYVITYPCLDWN